MLFVDLFKGNHSVEFIWLPMFSTQMTRHKRLKKKRKKWDLVHSNASALKPILAITWVGTLPIDYSDIIDGNIPFICTTNSPLE